MDVPSDRLNSHHHFTFRTMTRPCTMHKQTLRVLAIFDFILVLLVQFLFSFVVVVFVIFYRETSCAHICLFEFLSSFFFFFFSSRYDVTVVIFKCCSCFNYYYFAGRRHSINIERRHHHII